MGETVAKRVQLSNYHMIKSECVCNNKASFLPFIVYKNETVFAEYEGTIIGKCTKCGLLKTFPKKHSKKFNPLITKAKEYEKRREEFETLFQPIVQAVEKYVPKNGTVLDVGCSSGLLLGLLKKEGYVVKGIEPNESAFKIAHKKLGDCVINETLHPASHKAKYDCIIYNHVLEHIEDIQKEFSCINTVLKKNGILIIGVPNTDNCIFYIRKKYWEYLLPNEHIWHFNANYLLRFLRRLKYSPLEVSFSHDKRSDYPWIKRCYFSLLCLGDTLFHTGESTLIVAKKT